MKAMIFAAGLGTRLKPLTDTMPKALVTVDGKPLIEIIARKLRDSGFREAVVNVHHFADMICEWVDVQDIMDIRVSDERARLLETGGGILHARELLQGSGAFLVHNVDILSNADLSWLSGQHRDDALATLLVSPRESSRHFLFRRSDMRLAGWENVKTGERLMAIDVSVFDCVALSFSGIHIISDAVFPIMEDYISGLCPSMSSTALETSSGSAPKFSIRDFYLWAASRYPIYGINDPNLRLLDVGKVGSLNQASDFLATC